LRHRRWPFFLLLSAFAWSSFVNGLLPGPAQAQGGMSCQVLDGRASQASFSLSLGMVQSQGDIEELSGSLILDPADPTKTKAHIEANLESLAIYTAGQRNIILERAIQAASPGKLIFESSQFRRISADRFLVNGLLRRGAQEHQISFPVRLLKYQRQRSRISGNLSRSGAHVLPNLPYQASGEASFDLVFVQSACSSGYP
jgi:polyisoprenoid-binding protein YceI